MDWRAARLTLKGILQPEWLKHLKTDWCAARLILKGTLLGVSFKILSFIKLCSADTD
jgi:hypothetical protein